MSVRLSEIVSSAAACAAVAFDGVSWSSKMVTKPWRLSDSTTASASASGETEIVAHCRERGVPADTEQAQDVLSDHWQTFVVGDIRVDAITLNR